MQPLLLLHGALGDSSQFHRLLPLLRNRFEVYTFDFAGHGSSQAERNFSINGFAEQTKEFIEQHSLHGLDIFGYSMGGYVALKAALLVPNRIRHIQTLGTKFDWSPAAAEREIRLLHPDNMERKVPKFAAALKEVHGPENWKNVVMATARMMQTMAAGEQLKPEDFQSIQIPVTICLGSMDEMVTKEESMRVASLLRNAMFQVIDGFKHPIDSIETEDLAKCIMRSF